MHASSTLQSGRMRSSPELRRMKFSVCARAYSRRSPSQSIMPPSHFMRMALSRSSMYALTLGSTMMRSMACAVGATAVKRVAATAPAATTRSARERQLASSLTGSATARTATGRGPDARRGAWGREGSVARLAERSASMVPAGSVDAPVGVRAEASVSAHRERYAPVSP